ncbi:ABC transporter permease [Haloglomus litoreum]|uniref:ABC transporter permease n=1 Tax=Haloglomus litoreum TaxID=3034026 RepID=UPI0023E8E459|nr:ABC transporter permease [Haloglomus sp. DT116]
MLSQLTRMADVTRERMNGSVGDWLDRQSLTSVPPVLYILVLLVVPVAYIIYISWFEYNALTIVSTDFTTQYYEQLLLESFYRNVLWYTFKVAIITSVLCAVLGYGLGYFIANTTPLKRQITLFSVFLPLMVGTVTRLYGWMILLGGGGVINTYLDSLFGFQMELIGNTNAIIIGMVGVFLPFVVLPVYSAVEDIPESYVLAARNLGANRAESFVEVTLPLSLHGLLSGTVIVFALSMSTIVTPQILGGRTNLMMGELMYSMASNFNWPFASAIATVLAVLTISAVYGYFNVFRTRMEVES